MQIFQEIPFIKPQNDKQQINSQKQWKMKEKDILFGFSFYSGFGVWKIVGIFELFVVLVKQQRLRQEVLWHLWIWDNRWWSYCDGVQN